MRYCEFRSDVLPMMSPESLATRFVDDDGGGGGGSDCVVTMAAVVQ